MEDMDINSLRQAIDKEMERHRREGSSEKTEKVLGGLFTVSAPVASLLNGLINWWQPVIRRNAEGAIRSFGNSLPEGSKGKNALNIAAHSVGWGMTFYDELIGVGSNVRKYNAEIGELKEKLSKVSVSNGGRAHHLDGLKGNEILLVEQNRAKENFKNRLTYDATKLIASLPQAYIKIKDHEQELHKATVQQQTKKSVVEDYKSFRNRHHDLPADDVRWMFEQQEKRAHRSMDAHKAPDSKMLDTWAILGSVGSEVAKDAVAKDKTDTYKNTALDMITKLSDTVIEKDNTSVDGIKIDTYIRDIFNTHQKNMGQPEIGKRFKKDFEYACKEIAEAITEGRMHPMSMVNLVGERSIVSDQGKHIATKEEVAHAIEEQIKRRPPKYAVDADKYIAEATVGTEDLKQELDKKSGAAKAFFIESMPEEVAKKVGANDATIKEAHDMMENGEYARTLAKSVLDLATLSDEQLETGKLSKEQIKLIRETAPLARDGKEDALLEKLTRKGKYEGALDTLVVDAMGSGLLQNPGDLYARAGGQLHGDKEMSAHQEVGKELTEKPHNGWDALDAEAANDAPEAKESHSPHHKVHHTHYEGKNNEHYRTV